MTTFDGPEKMDDSQLINMTENSDAMIKVSSDSRHEHGQSLVELAISIVFIFFLLAGIIDLGRAFFVYMALRDAAQEGALYGSFCPHDTAGILQRIQQSSSSAIVDISNAAYTSGSDVEVTCNYIISLGTTGCTGTTGSVTQGDRIEVTVKYASFPISMPFLGAFVENQQFEISATMFNAVISTECPIN